MATNIDAGVGQHATVTNPTGKAGSVTQNPLTPVQAGYNSAKSAYTTVTSSDPLVPEISVGPIATITGVGTTSVKGDGTETAVATTSSGIGTGATITYTVASNVASAFTLVDAGTNYAVDEVLTVVGDTGVTVKVATIA